MTVNSYIQIGLYLLVLLLLVKPLGSYIAHVFQNERTFLTPIVGPIERLVYRVARIHDSQEMDWRTYAVAFLLFSLAGIVLLYFLQRIQGILPLNPQHLEAVKPDLAFNTAVSFVTNTNWQNYSGERTLSYFTQMTGLTVQNFLSAASGISVLVAMIRGFIRHSATTIGNFWIDITRSILYILLPLSIVLALILVSQGVVQTLHGSQQVSLIQSTSDSQGLSVDNQTIALGPAASQIAIKQLGTNGGGFFNTNSAHPFENPTPLSNFLEMVSILLIPAALCYTFGKMVGNTRQGWAIFAAMSLIFVVMLAVTVSAENSANPNVAGLNVDSSPSSLQSGGNMEGKETRFGITDSAIWATATTSASNGSVNSMHDSFTPIGGLVPMWLMQIGEVVFGGVGSGLYGMLAFAIIAVFVAGLLVGRSPEYLGKKIEAYEMKMAALIVLIPVLLVLIGTAVAVSLPAGREAVFNNGPHGFSEILYAFSSVGNNNGSAFAGIGSNTVFYNIVFGLVMLISRFWLAIPVLAIAGSLVKKKQVPVSSGTLSTHTPLFVFWLIAIVVIVGALSFLPALSLGPIIEYLQIG
jgi:potassium-transporting ATPase potassium-binding subunit